MTLHFVNLLDELLRRSLRMASLVEDIVHESFDAVLAADERLARRVIARDQEVDAEEVAVEAEVIRLLALYQPVGSDLRLLCTILKVNSDLERIADCAVNIAERACHLDAGAVSGADEGLRQMSAIVARMLRSVLHAYGASDADHARNVFADEEMVDALYGKIIQKMATDSAASASGTAAILDILSVAKNLERIADHVTNIAEDMVFLSTGDIVRHRPR